MGAVPVIGSATKTITSVVSDKREGLIFEQLIYEIPYIFRIPPEFHHVDLFDFKECIYGYYQICLGADGYVYRCTTVSTPTFKNLRLGKITNNLEEFNQMILKNQDQTFNCDQCFCQGGRCNRMGLEINREWKTLTQTKK